MDLLSSRVVDVNDKEKSMNRTRRYGIDDMISEHRFLHGLLYRYMKSSTPQNRHHGWIKLRKGHCKHNSVLP